MRLTHLMQNVDGRKNKEPMIKIRNKLFDLENIEDELGIDLIVYLRMTLGTRVFVKDKIYDGMFENGIMEQRFLKYIYNSNYKCFCLNFHGSLTPIYYMKDYGKEWALTKEELE